MHDATNELMNNMIANFFIDYLLFWFESTKVTLFEKQNKSLFLQENQPL